MPYRVSKAKFGELVEQALADVPPPFDELLEEVPVEIRDRATSEQRRRAKVGPGSLLLGLYHGTALTRRSVEDSGRMPDVIYIFQTDIEEVVNSEAELVEQVRVTVLHEIGHHFGLDEEDLRRVGYG